MNAITAVYLTATAIAAYCIIYNACMAQSTTTIPRERHVPYCKAIN